MSRKILLIHRGSRFLDICPHMSKKIVGAQLEDELEEQVQEEIREPEAEEIFELEEIEPVTAAREQPEVEVVETVTLEVTEPEIPKPEKEEKRQEKPTSDISSSRQGHGNYVRVDLTKLDEIMQMVGELVISRSRLDTQLKKMEVSRSELRPLEETNKSIQQQLWNLREGVMRMRLVPIGEVFTRMQFLVRDLARENGKQVGVELVGQETEIDKFLVERLMDPLLHLVRNAISHGLETEAERRKLGKPPIGHLTLRATTAGETVLVEIEDDGRGIDVKKVIEKAQAKGLREAGAERDVDSNTLLQIICAPGFSTREEADLTSGRGVGMSVVKNMVQELGGVLTLETKPGKGTKFTMQLPLTLAIAQAMIVTVGGQTFAMPQSYVQEVMEVQSKDITSFQKDQLISYRGRILPLLYLSGLFELKAETNGRFHALVVGSQSMPVGIGVDRIIGSKEIVVRTMHDPILQVPGIAGATDLGDGKVVLILDATDLIAMATHKTSIS